MDSYLIKNKQYLLPMGEGRMRVPLNITVPHPSPFPEGVNGVVVNTPFNFTL